MPERQAAEDRWSALQRAGLAVYCLAWGVMFVVMLAMPILAAAELATLDGPTQGSSAAPALPFDVEIWLLYSLNLCRRCSSPPRRPCCSGAAGATAWR